MNFSFNVTHLGDDTMKLDEILDSIDNKVIAGQIALVHVCGTQGYEADFYLPNVKTEEDFNKDIKNVLDAFKNAGEHIRFYVEKNIYGKNTVEYYESMYESIKK